jgi:hypothetical protein
MWSSSHRRRLWLTNPSKKTKSREGMRWGSWREGSCRRRGEEDAHLCSGSPLARREVATASSRAEQRTAMREERRLLTPKFGKESDLWVRLDK